MSDLYPRPSREAIAAQVTGQQPPGTRNEDDGLGDVVSRRDPEPQPQPGDDVLAWFSAHVRIALRVRGWSKVDLARACGGQAADVTRAANGQACGLALAGRIAASLGRDLAEMVRPVKCDTCAGNPPSGFRCLECGTETRIA